MADIQKLTYPYFTDGTTQLNAANLNPIIAKINEVIDKVNGGVTPTQTVATPTISISGTTATISCSTSGATIYYTLNGNTPTTSSTQYSSPITLSGACTIKAIAVKSGMNNSQVASVDYTPTTIDITDAILATTWEAGGIKHADGGIQSAQSFDHSDYFDVSTYAGKVLNYSRIVRDSSTSSPIGLAFYDSSQQYISGQGLHHSAAENGWEDYDCDIPSTAKYVRMSWYNSTGSGSEWANDFYAKIKEPTT